MGRKATGWWDKRAKRWFARLGAISDDTGKPTTVMLKDEYGRPIRKTDTKGKNLAIQRLVSSRRLEPILPGPTVAEACSEFVKWHKNRGSAERTVMDHWYHLKRFSAFEHDGVTYGERRAADITPDDVWRIEDSGIGAIRQLYGSIIGCWIWAARPIAGRIPSVMIPKNLLDKIERPPEPPKVKKLMPWQHIRIILRCGRAFARMPARTRIRRTRLNRWMKAACLTTMAHTGARTGEVVEMEWGDICWDPESPEKGHIIIPSERTKTRKTGKDRYVAFPPRIGDLFKAIAKIPEHHPKYVFCLAWHKSIRERKPDFWRWVRDDLKPYVDRQIDEWNARRSTGTPPSEITTEWTPYWMRHTFATAASRLAGAKAAAAALGHSEKMLDKTYDHGTAEKARAVADKVVEDRRRKPDQ